MGLLDLFAPFIADYNWVAVIAVVTLGFWFFDKTR